MDLKNRKFRITEAVNGFSVEVEVPKYKRASLLLRLFGAKAYYDEKDLQWAPVTVSGNVLLRGQQIPFATFPNITNAREFVKKIQAPKKTTVIGEDGKDMLV